MKAPAVKIPEEKVPAGKVRAGKVRAEKVRAEKIPAVTGTTRVHDRERNVPKNTAIKTHVVQLTSIAAVKSNADKGISGDPFQRKTALQTTSARTTSTSAKLANQKTKSTRPQTQSTSLSGVGTAPRGHSQRVLGAFYTPSHAVDYALGLLPPRLLAAGNVLEPSGGDGAFVQGCLRRGVAPHHITVWDINPETAAAITELGANFSPGDTLLRNVDTVRGTCHVVVGNPPYLSKQSAYVKQHGKALQRRFPAISSGEVYAMFVAHALEMLRPGGELVFIISDTWRTLSTHARFRELLLTQTTVRTVTRLPRALFAAAGASVDTCVLHVRKERAPQQHRVLFHDCGHLAVGNYSGTKSRIAQSALAHWPNQIFAWPNNETVAALASLQRQPIRLLDRLEGGLGLYTPDNAVWCARIRPATATARVPRVVASGSVDGVRWRVYHKTGGIRDWWTTPTNVIDWRPTAQAQYQMPASFSAVWTDTAVPLLISGVSDRLSARLGVRGGVWNSNKCFGFLPRAPHTESVYFWLAVLNSSTLRHWAAILNHTPSLQLRDLTSLRVPRFTARERRALDTLGRACVAAAQAGRTPVKSDITRIDSLVAAAAKRS